ncbi:MAG: hypothetical protein E7530_03245 [Ruminococcaceae bacterium]|nr:hypothetical protein [Oscillospiraceae bacterium]
MFCSNCGSNVEEGTFCPICGAQVEENAGNNTMETEVVKVTEAPDPKENNDDSEKKKQKKVLTPEEQAQRKKVITKLIVAGSFFLFAMSMLFVAIFVGFLAINNPANEILENLENGYYYSASSIYENDMNSKPNKKLVEGLNERLDDIWAEYQSDSYSYYDDIGDELETIEEMNIEEISEKLQETITNVETLHNSREAFEEAQSEEYYEDYVDAIYYYGQVIATDSNYEAAQEKIKELMPIYRSGIFDSVDDKTDYGYYSSAFEILLDAKEAFPNDTEINQKITDCEALVVSEADKLVAEKKYDDAIELVGEAMDGYPESETLNAKLESIQKGRPVYLQDLTTSLTSKNYDYDSGSFTDANGVEHDGKFKFDPGLDEGKTANAEFYLEKKYTKFTATFVPNSSTNDKEKFKIEVLVDGKVVKTIKNFTFKSKNEIIELDITGASKIEIRVKSTDWNYYNYISMTDACVYQ